MPRSDMVDLPVLPDPERPYPGESFPSLIACYAGEIGMTYPSRVLTPIGLEHTTLCTLATQPHDEMTTAALRQLFDLDAETFVRIRSWTAEPARALVLGHLLPARSVSFAQRRFCPACLAEAPFHRAVWDITTFPGCGRHRVALRHACPECGSTPRWTRMWSHRCSNPDCSADLSLHQVDFDFDDGLADTCLQVESLFHEGVPGSAAPLSVGDTLEAAARLGSYALRVPWESVAAAWREDPTLLARVMQAGMAALANWPDGLHDYLGARREESATRKGRHGAAKELGPVTGWIWSERDGTIGQLLRPAVDAWIAGRSDMTTRIVRVGTIRETGRTPALSVAQAARRLGIGVLLMRKVAEQRGLFTVAPDGSGAMALIDGVALESLVAGRATAVDRKGACALLGVGNDSLVAMLDAGLVREMPVGDRILKELGFDRTELATLLERLENAATNTGSVEGAQSLKKTGIGMPGGMARLLRSVLDGHVRPVGVDASAKGLNRLLFAVDDKVLPVRTVPDGYVSPGDLGKLLGIDRTSMTEMVAAGLFGPAEEGVWHRQSRPVSDEAVRRFRRECVMTPEIAAESGLPWQGLVARLRRLGVEPISGPGVDKLRRHVFRRLEVNAVIEPLKSETQIPSSSRTYRVVQPKEW